MEARLGHRDGGGVVPVVVAVAIVLLVMVAAVFVELAVVVVRGPEVPGRLGRRDSPRRFDRRGRQCTWGVIFLSLFGDMKA